MSKKPSMKQRLQYQFDNIMSHGAPAMIGTLAVLSIIIVLLASVIVVVGGRAFAPGGAGDGSFIEVVWGSLLRTLDPGTMGGDEGWGFRLVMLILPTLGGIFIISSLIGVLSNLIQDKIEELRKGRSLVLEEGHTVIVGWSPLIFTILKELIEANLNQGKSAIVILVAKGKVEMEDEIRAQLPDTKNTRVVCRSGSPIVPLDLEIVNLHQAQSIIVIPTEGIDPDTFVIKTVLAITNNPKRRTEPYNIVTQINNEAHRDLLALLGNNDHIDAVLTEDVIARITAQTSLQSGLSLIYTELLNFSGDEIYFTKDLALTGQGYGTALSAYVDSSVIGIYNTTTQQARLNPPTDYQITADDMIICIAADDDPLEPRELKPIGYQEDLIVQNFQPAPPEKKKQLLLGWNRNAREIVQELDKYVAKGSLLTIVADASFESELATCCQLKNQAIKYIKGDKTDRSLLDRLNIMDYDHVIVLADYLIDIQEADARTLVTLLHLRDIDQKDDTPYSIVSEMLDLRNRELASVAKVDDFIVSTHMISLMLAQLSQNNHLMPVFEDILDEEGSEIYLKPVEQYVILDEPMNFYTVVEAARRRGETAIGYRSLSQWHDESLGFGVHLNPNKLKEITFSAGDKVIVFAE